MPRCRAGTRIAVNHGFNLVFLQSGEPCTLQHVVQSAYTLDAGIHCRERIVGAEQDLVPDAVLLHQHQRVIQLERTIVQRGAIRIHIRMLADDDNAFALIRMAQVSHDDLHIGKANGHLVEQNRPSAVAEELCR